MLRTKLYNEVGFTGSCYIGSLNICRPILGEILISTADSPDPLLVRLLESLNSQTKSISPGRFTIWYKLDVLLLDLRRFIDY